MEPPNESHDAPSDASTATSFVDVGNEIDAIIREQDSILPSGRKTHANPNAFYAPIQPLCVTVNYTGSRVAVGHTKGFLLYEVRYVDARHALAEEEAAARELENAATAVVGDTSTAPSSVPASGHRSVTNAPTRANPFKAPIPAYQLVPIVCVDENERLIGRDDKGLQRPDSHLYRYGKQVPRRSRQGTNLFSSTGTAKSSAEGDEEEEEEDCEWAASLAAFSSANTKRDEPPAFAGAGTVSLLFNTTYIGVVGGGPRPIGPPNKLHIFSGTTLTSTITVSGAIERLEMTSGSVDRSTQVCMLTRDQFFLIYLFNGELRYRAPTHTLNDCLSQPLCVNSSRCYVSFPSSNVGGFEVARYSDSTNIAKICSVPKAHSHPISSITLSAEGDVCVTSSVNGTLIRVWDIREGSSQQGAQLSELRTSPIPCRIRHIGISSQGNYIFALVNSVNVCVFYIGKEVEAKAYDVSTKDPNAALAMNHSSYLSKLSFISSFFGSKWAASTMALPSSMLPSALLKGTEYYGRAGVRSGGQATAATAVPTVQPSQGSITGGLMGKWWGGGQPPQPSEPLLGGGETSGASPTPTSSASAPAPQGSSYYYGGALMQTFYSSASKAVALVASASGVTVGGANSGVVVVSDSSATKDTTSVRHSPENSTANAAGNHDVGVPPVAAKDMNGRTADDVLGMWWEQQALAAELSRPVVWDTIDLEGYRTHVAERCTDWPSGGKEGKNGGNGASAITKSTAGGDAPTSDANHSDLSPTVSHTAPSKEILCIVNGYGELLRVEFNPVGGKLVPLPITPAKE